MHLGSPKGKAAAASAEESGGLVLKPNSQKARRDEEGWRYRWPAPPGEDGPATPDVDKLREMWSSTLEKDAIPAFFPKVYLVPMACFYANASFQKVGSMEVGKKAMDMLVEAVHTGPQLDVHCTKVRAHLYAGGDLYLDHLDLILKWCTIRLCEREMMPAFIRLLEVNRNCAIDWLRPTCAWQLLKLMLDGLVERGYILTDFEASIIIPYLFEKSGNAKDRIAKSFKEVHHIP